MSGGTINGNICSSAGSAYRGGGVSVGGDFTMSGGDISENSAYHGGGVYVGGDFTMSDGTISGNTASSNGGGVYVDGAFTMSDGIISENSAYYGGGVFLAMGGTFAMNGGTISDNSSSSFGKGIFVNSFNHSYTDNVWRYQDIGLIISGKARIDPSNNIVLYVSFPHGSGYTGIVFTGDPSALDYDISVDLWQYEPLFTLYLNQWTGEIIQMEGGGPVPESVRSRFKLGTFTNSVGTEDISAYIIKSDGKGSWRETAEMLSFTVNGVEAPISRSMSLVFPYNTDLTHLAPEITVSPGAKVFPESGAVRNFSAPLTYWVSAADGTIKTYTVDIQCSGYIPTGGLTILDRYTPGSEDIELALDGDTYTITAVGTGYTNYRWYVDGIPRGFSDSINLNAYSKGTYSVSLTADKNGVPYSAKVIVQVQ
jgi:parallel beta-helix repeat protein